MTGYRSTVDMMGRTVLVPESPQRIVSVVPSQTELLADLGLEKEVVGITKFCIHPDVWFRGKQRVGGTKKLRLEAIDALNPDLILANKEENTKEQIEALGEKYPVWVSDISSFDDAIEMIERVGAITGKQAAAEEIILRTRKAFDWHQPTGKLRVVYLIWREPWMCAGSGTFISDMIERLGFENAVVEPRYPQIDLTVLNKMHTDIVLLSSEPYPFKEKHIEEIRSFLPGAVILLVDGEMFSWYGSRMIVAGNYMHQLVDKINHINVSK